jgi:hypothetical protein
MRLFGLGSRGRFIVIIGKRFGLNWIGGGSFKSGGGNIGFGLLKGERFNGSTFSDGATFQ